MSSTDETRPTPSAPGMTRRALLQRGAVVGAVVWSAPIIQSVPAFAQTGGSRPPSPFCLDGSNEPKPTSLTLRYEPTNGCPGDTTAAGQPQDCKDCASTPHSSPAFIRAAWGTSSGAGSANFAGVVAGGQIVVGTGTTMQPTLLLVVCAQEADCPEIVRDGNNTKPIGFKDVPCGPTIPVQQAVNIHTSCSRPLNIGESYGDFRIVSGTT